MTLSTPLVQTLGDDGIPKWAPLPSSGGLPPGWWDPYQFMAGVGQGNAAVDTAAFQAAINQASLAASSGYWPGGDTIYIRPNRKPYLVTGLKYGVSGLTFRGGGKRSTVLQAAPGYVGSLFSPATVDASTAYMDLTFEDLALEGNNTATIGVDLTSTRECVFNRVVFGWFTQSGMLAQCGPNGGTGVNDSIGHNITACVFENMIGAAPSILIRTNPNDLKASGQGYTRISGCWFNGNGPNSTGVAGQMMKVNVDGNYFMNVVNPLNIAGQNNWFQSNDMENYAAGGVNLTIQANGPGQGSATGLPSISNYIGRNRYSAPQGALKIIDNGANTQLDMDGGGYGVFGLITKPLPTIVPAS